MADPIFLTDCKVWLGGYDVTGNLNAVDFGLAMAELTEGRFGDTLDAKYPGLVVPTVSANGFYALADDAAILPRLTVPDRTSWPLTLGPPSAPSDAGTDGNVCYTITGAESAYMVGRKHGALRPYSLKRMPRSGGAAARQTIVLAKATRSATTTGTGRQLGVLSATQKLVAVLHVFLVTGGTWTLTIESDDNSGFTSATTRMTFTGATDITREVQVLNGAIATDDYWRAVLTKVGGTSCSAAVALGIVPIDGA